MKDATLPPKPPGAFLPRLLWPLVALTVATLAVAGLGLAWLGDRADRAAAEAARARIQSVVDVKVADFVARLRVARDAALAEALDEASPVEALDRLVDLARPHFETLALARVGADGAPSVEILGTGGVGARPAPALSPASVAALAELVGLAEEPHGGVSHRTAAGLRAFDGEIVVVAAAPAEAVVGERGALVVGVKTLAPEKLARLADDQDVSEVSIGEGPIPAGAQGFDILGADGAPALHVAWRLDEETGRIGPSVLAYSAAPATIALCLLALALLHARRVSAELASTQRRAQTLATSDPLSGLPNRLLFSERLDLELARLDRGGEGLAVMFLDLDRFKEVNDSFGHQAGDQLIKEVALRLMTLLRGTDMLARFGGDEFAVIQTQVDEVEAAEALARRILAAIGEPFVLDQGTVTVGVSIGVALAPDDARDRESLMRLADTALYQAKNDGRNRYSLFERRMDEAIRLRKLVGDDLREAIATDALALHYQPVYAADGSRIVGVEALVRWPHPEKGLIQPDRFVPLAEQSGLVIPLGDWVLRRACLDGARWPDVRVAVNVSPIQFRQRDYVDVVTRILEETGFDPARLELELTEGVVVEDADAAEAAMMRLRALGVNLALDDFGTGYSSLIYLRRFAFDKIKIDRSFLESMEATGESAILVHSIVHLGRALGLTVTAEGVETKEQQRFLQALGCHQLQGFLFARPMPAQEFDALLARQRAA